MKIIESCPVHDSEGELIGLSMVQEMTREEVREMFDKQLPPLEPLYPPGPRYVDCFGNDALTYDPSIKPGDGWADAKIKPCDTFATGGKL